MINSKDTTKLAYNKQINIDNPYDNLNYSFNNIREYHANHNETTTHELSDSDIINSFKTIISGIKFLDSCNNSKPSRQYLLTSLLDLIDKIKKGKINNIDQIKHELITLAQLINQEINGSLTDVSDLCTLIDSVANNDFDSLTIQKLEGLLNQIKADSSTQNIIAIINNICNTEFDNYNQILNYLSSTNINPQALELATMVLFSDALNNFELSVNNANPDAQLLATEVADFQHTISTVANNLDNHNINTEVDLFNVIANIKTTDNDPYSNLPQLIKLLESYNINWKSGTAVDRMLVSDIFRSKIMEINKLASKLKPATKKSLKLSEFEEDEKHHIIVSKKQLSDLSDECDEILNSL